MNLQYGIPYAAACVSGKRGSSISGTVRFYVHGDGTLVVAQISGLPESETGFHGFHIHEGTSCRGEGFCNTGGHFNPGKTEHPAHAGDLPPLLANMGRAYFSVWTCRFRPEDVIGKTVVIHSNPDDFHSQPAGDAGEKIACGVIRRI